MGGILHPADFRFIIEHIYKADNQKMESTIVKSIDYNAYFGDNHVVKNVNIEIPRNTVIAVMGPSGCGKTTFLRGINRMHELIPGATAKGKIMLNNEDVLDSLTKKGSFLSGGQQQRLCIARAVAMEPEVLLFDEPTSALDPISTSTVEELFHELKANYTLIIVTHNMQQAARVSDKTAFFYMGELVEYDETKIMFTNPKDSRTQNYITGRFS